MGLKIMDEDFTIHVLGNSPEEYKSKVESLEKKIDNLYDPLTVERMVNELNMKYKKICKKNDYDSDEDEKEDVSKANVIHVGILDTRAQIALTRKMTQKMTQQENLKS